LLLEAFGDRIHNEGL
jgi:hypothetical protein